MQLKQRLLSRVDTPASAPAVPVAAGSLAGGKSISSGKSDDGVTCGLKGLAHSLWVTVG